MKLTKYVFVVLMFALAACGVLGNVRSNVYKDYEAVVDAGGIEQGWVPAFLPRSATDIRLARDVDTQAVLLAFNFAPVDREALTQVCVPVDEVTVPALQAEWWEDVQNNDTFVFYSCPKGYLAVGTQHGYFWSGVILSVAELHVHPKRYQYLDGQRVVVTGYVDFANILDKREMAYDDETLGFVVKPGQMAESVFFANFDDFVDPHPLFDRLHCLQPRYEALGVQLVLTGTLSVEELPMNFNTGLGYGIDIHDLDSVAIRATECATPTVSSLSIVPLLPNTNYAIDVTSTGMAQLADGVFEEDAAPGSASKTRVSLGHEMVTGDLDGDSMPDAAVTLIADPGGSGTFTYLAAVLNREGVAEPIPAVLLGDRIVIEFIFIEEGKITVTWLTRQADEPMSAEPTIVVTRVFQVQDAALVEL